MHDLFHAMEEAYQPEIDSKAVSNRKIGQQLVITDKTVGTHVQRILTKLDVHSRAAAVAFAYRKGLVEDVSAHGPAVPAGAIKA